MHLTRRHRFRLHESGRAGHHVDQRQAPGVGPGAVDRCQQRLPRTGPRDAVGEHQPQPVPGTGAGERRVRHSLQPIEQWPPVHDDAGRGRIVEDDDQGGRRVQRAARGAGRQQRPGRGEDDRHDQRGTQHEQQKVSQPQPPRAAPLGVRQVADGGKGKLRRDAPLEQMQQRGNRGRREPRERQRMQKTHVSSRSARPKGKSVVTWW